MFFDRPESGELAVLVHLDLSQADAANDPREFEELVLSAGGDPVEFIRGSRPSPDARYFVGSGKLEELEQAVLQNNAELVIFNHELSPSQERNLEKVLKCRVLDRTGLILDIFAQRARTHEGKLQVELAQLEHMSTRLIRGWTHLERQKGGIGLRGPGETQLETDRRLLRGRIKTINKRLGKVRKQREQGRRARTRAEIPMLSLVGYTNAGKSSLFNRLTESEVFAEDQLFATLDPTMRRLQIPDYGRAVLADTVGFISNLPHKLVESFRATLEEAAKADLLLHVVDCAAEERLHYQEQVNLVLEEIEAHTLPVLLVFNKIDLIDTEARIDRDDKGRALAVWLSARSGAGCDLLLQALGERLRHSIVEARLSLKPSQARLRAQLFNVHAVLEERFMADGGSELDIRVAEEDLNKILSSENLTQQDLDWQSVPESHKQLAS